MNAPKLPRDSFWKSLFVWALALLTSLGMAYATGNVKTIIEQTRAIAELKAKGAAISDRVTKLEEARSELTAMDQKVLELTTQQQTLNEQQKVMIEQMDRRLERIERAVLDEQRGRTQ